VGGVIGNGEVRGVIEIVLLKCSEKSYSMRAKFYGPHRKGEEVYNTKKRKEGEKKE
jgi:hypothetical protein